MGICVKKIIIRARLGGGNYPRRGAILVILGNRSKKVGETLA